MADQVWIGANATRSQKTASTAVGEGAGKGVAIAPAVAGTLTLTQRVLKLLESRGYFLLLLAGLVGSLSLPGHAQQFIELPSAPSFNKKLFIGELAAYTTMNILDGITTAQSLHEGNIEGSFPGGSSYLLGQRPSAARYAVTMGLMEAGVSLTAYRLQHSRNKWLRVAGHGLMIQAAYGHTDGTIRNIRLLQAR
jgi:hypothetical protein